VCVLFFNKRKHHDEQFYFRLNQQWTQFKVILVLLQKKKKFLNCSLTHLKSEDPSKRWQTRARSDEKLTTNSFYNKNKSQTFCFFMQDVDVCPLISFPYRYQEISGDLLLV